MVPNCVIPGCKPSLPGCQGFVPSAQCPGGMAPQSYVPSTQTPSYVPIDAQCNIAGDPAAVLASCVPVSGVSNAGNKASLSRSDSFAGIRPSGGTSGMPPSIAPGSPGHCGQAASPRPGSPLPHQFSMRGRVSGSPRRAQHANGTYCGSGGPVWCHNQGGSVSAAATAAVQRASQQSPRRGVQWGVGPMLPGRGMMPPLAQKPSAHRNGSPVPVSARGSTSSGGATSARGVASSPGGVNCRGRIVAAGAMGSGGVGTEDPFRTSTPSASLASNAKAVRQISFCSLGDRGYGGSAAAPVSTCGDVYSDQVRGSAAAPLTPACLGGGGMPRSSATSSRDQTPSESRGSSVAVPVTIVDSVGTADAARRAFMTRNQIISTPNFGPMVNANSQPDLRNAQIDAGAPIAGGARPLGGLALGPVAAAAAAEANALVHACNWAVGSNVAGSPVQSYAQLQAQPPPRSSARTVQRAPPSSSIVQGGTHSLAQAASQAGAVGQQVEVQVEPVDTIQQPSQSSVQPAVQVPVEALEGSDACKPTATPCLGKGSPHYLPRRGSAILGGAPSAALGGAPLVLKRLSIASTAVANRPPSPIKQIPFADLEFTENLGSGEFGQVFRGRHTGQDVAIKQLFWDGSSHPSAVLEELIKEIESFRHLRHPRLVSFIGACLEMPNLCLVTEYAPGGSLHHLLHARQFKLPTRHSANMCLQLADGVRYLHSLKPIVVHRDLKSLNVVLDLNFNIKLCDFGLTESMERTHISKTNNGGSPRYMAPELFDQNTKITEKIDVWSMGCIFIEMFGGPLPYTGIDTLADLTRALLVNRKTPVIPRSTPDGFKNVIRSCHYHDPALRPASRDAYEQLLEAKRALPRRSDEVAAAGGA